MSVGWHLPLPPRIQAIASLDDLEELADAFKLDNGYYPELLSHWDPKPEFEAEIASWISRDEAPTSLVRYVYSSYLNIDNRIRKRLGEGAERGLLLTPSGTTSIATVMTYLASIGIHHLSVVTPAYFVVEALAASLRVPVSFSEIIRKNRGYRLPDKLATKGLGAIWLTFPVYGASCYFSPTDVGRFIDSLPDDVIVIIDESLAYPDRDSLAETRSFDRVIRITTPHKSLCLNGEKISVVTFPAHLTDSLNAISECFAGGIGASGMRALRFLGSDFFDRTVTCSRELSQTLLARMLRVLGNRSTVSSDEGTDGHFVMLYWPHIPMSQSRDAAFLKAIVYESGAVPMPAARNRHPEAYGFAFRVNLLRLDDAGLGGLKRLADALDRLA